MIKNDDKDFKTYRFKISDLATLFDLEKNKKIYNQMRIITRNLLKKGLEISIPEKKELLQINWMYKAHYYFDEGFIELAFSPDLKPYLLNLKKLFLSYSFENIITLKSSYSIRIYELLKQYVKIGKRRFKYQELREILGIKQEEYKFYNDFRRYVLLVSQKELEAKTDISFKFNAIKTGRKVTEIEFIILPNNKIKKQEKQSNSSQETPESELLDQLLDMKISNRQAKNLIKKHAPDVIKRNIELVKKRASNGAIESVPGYLIDAIKNDYAQNADPADSGSQKLRAEARQCQNRNPTCRARWNSYKDNKSSPCHYCQRFEKQRRRDNSTKVKNVS